jgi:hypothetical protein
MVQIGICGDNCSYCPRYVATQDGSVNELEEVKELWVRLGFRDPAFLSRDLACDGCKPENKCAYPELHVCAREKGIDNCGLCEKYPCELISDAFKRTEELRSRAIRICTPQEMDTLYKAFFSKKESLDRIHHEIDQDIREE